MRLTEALSLAGGPSENADNGDIRIVRGDPRHPDAYAVSLHALARGESNDPILAPGDVVVVPQAGSVDIARVMTVLGPVLATLTSVAVTVIVVLATR
jgi:protein involved in polysaccharide export with SLBB domain